MPNSLKTQQLTAPWPLLGSSPETIRAQAVFTALAAERGPALIVAEEGLEAESVARALHDASRPGQPFVAVSTAQEEPAQFELALFGARPRAGTQTMEIIGASGALATAGRGTVFIEAVGDLPASAQRRLARLLRDGEARVAGRGATPLQARVIASARPTIDAEVNDGRVLADLHRRLAAHELTLPPLRTRPGDFAVLVPALAASISAHVGRPRPSFTQSALNVLAALPWRRNISELKALLERILRATTEDSVKQEDVLAQLSFDGAFARRGASVTLREARQRFERDYIAAVLEHHAWRMSDAARALGIERANLYRKTRQLGISRTAAAQAAAGQ